MGNADIPAAPTIGLILFFKNKLRNFAKSTPPAVSKIKAKRPKPSIAKVSHLKNFSAVIVEPIITPRSMVTRFASSFCAACDNLSKTPHSLIRFPNIKRPISETLSGATIPAIIVITIGNMIFTTFGTLTCL
ncbi:MAG: hypothetical protein BWY74_03993 [Firmicutes bacterium ADurb.Bin419]|nr:MAG: hypothetical protein BWY74_03993 [Firmicutes bacterium ADurb.Bin419]